MKNNHIEFGEKGELLAQQYLKKHSFEILDTNYSFRKGEIDIVALDEKELVIVEVKTRNSNWFGEPYLAVNRAKQRQIIKVANQYICEKKLQNEVRFDVVSIVLNSKQTSIEHIKNAFTPFV